MKRIQLTFNLTDKLGLRSVEFDYNSTHLPNDSELITKVCFAAIKAVRLNKDDMQLQDLLNELNIGLPKEGE
jgi:hypothetical protein